MSEYVPLVAKDYAAAIERILEGSSLKTEAEILTRRSENRISVERNIASLRISIRSRVAGKYNSGTLTQEQANKYCES